MRIIYHEARRLIKIEVLYNGSRGWTLTWEGKFKAIYGSVEDFAKLLRAIKAKDDATDPPSARSMTYLEIAQEIADGKDRTIWVWSNDLKKII